MSFTVTRLAYSDTASGSNTVLTVPSALPIGTTLAVGVASSGGSATLGLSDTKSNTWTQSYYGTNGTSPSETVAVYTTQLTTALTTSDTITATSSAGSGCGDIMLVKIEVNTGTISIGSGGTGGGSGTGNSTTPALTSALTPGASDLLLSFVVTNGTSTNTNTTAGTGFTKLAGMDGQVKNRAITGQYRSGTGSTTAPFTVSSTQQYATVAVKFTQSVPPPGGFGAEMVRFAYNGVSTKTVTGVPVTAAVPVGSFIVLLVNCNGNTANTTVTVTDSKSNTYALRQIALVNSSGSNGQPALVTCQVTTALTTSDTISATVNNAGSIVWGFNGVYFNGITGYDKGTTNNGASSQNLNSGTTAAAAQNSQMVVAGFGYTGAGVTLNTLPSGFTAQTPIATTGTVRNSCIVWGYVNVSGTRLVTAHMSDSASHAWGGTIIALNANAPTPVTQTWYLKDGTGTWVNAEAVIS